MYEDGAASRDGRLWAGDQILEVSKNKACQCLKCIDLHCPTYRISHLLSYLSSSIHLSPACIMTFDRFASKRGFYVNIIFKN